MYKLNFLVILGLCCLIRSLPVEKSKLFAYHPLRHMRIPTTSETSESKVHPTAEPLEARLYELAKKMGVRYTRPRVGLQHFGFEKPATKIEPLRHRPSRMPFRRPMGGRRKFVNFWPQKDESKKKAEEKEAEEEKKEEEEENYKDNAGEGETSPTRSQGRAGGAKSKEITLKVPHMKKDPKRGNWVYNPWGVTFGHPFMDTRFAAAKGRKPGLEVVRYRVDDKAKHKYDPTPDGSMSTVCRARSTLYNYPKIKYFLQRTVHNVSFDRRTIWMDLRKELADRGRSEECHTDEFFDFRAYQLCAMKRNQRMEYLIPQYPLHQIGYRRYYSMGQTNDDPIEVKP